MSCQRLLRPRAQPVAALPGLAVTLLAWPYPQPVPIHLVSPTRAEELRVCPRRVAYACDPGFASLKRSSESALAGIIAHAVYERVATGQYTYSEHSDATSVIDGLWGEETQRVAREFKHSWAPARTPDPVHPV